MLKLRDYRKRCGLTMKKFGELVGASEASISQYETGRVEPDIDLLSKMADILGVTVDNLIGRTEEQVTDIPRTEEARMLVRGIDQLPKEQREQALDVVRAMFRQYSDYFKSREEEHDSEP